MSGNPALDPSSSSSPSGMFSSLRAWLRARPGDGDSPSEAPAHLPGGQVGPLFGPVRMLVVDDNPVNLMLMTALMDSRGLVPLLAADGAEAVALACELQFDLILMDLQMPILDGLGATSAIRRFEIQSGRSAVPVVAYSSSPPGAGVLARHGLNGSLDKPCGDRDLEDCLVRWCPTYRPAPTARVAVPGHSRWAPASGAVGR